MTSDQLQQRLELSGVNRPVLIDVRARREYETSHLPGALWAESAQAISQVADNVPPTQPVVLYCSVGIRSSAAAQKLLESGRTNVFNLKGSIFQWANEGRTVVSNGRPVTVVDPYNQRWGRLLDPAHHPKL